MPQNQTLINQSRHVTTAKSRAITKINAVNSNENKIQLKITQTKLAKTRTRKVAKQTLAPTTGLPILPTSTTQTTEMTENKKLSTYSMRPVAKPTTPQRKAILEPIEQIDCTLGIKDRWHRAKTNGRTRRGIRMKLSRLRPKH